MNKPSYWMIFLPIALVIVTLEVFLSRDAPRFYMRDPDGRVVRIEGGQAQ